MDLNTELKNHILIEFSKHRMLFETRGVFGGMDEVVRALIDMVRLQLLQLYSGNENISCETYNSENDVFKNLEIETFFNKFNLSLEVVKAKNKQYSVYIKKDSLKYDENGNILMEPDIRLKIFAPSLSDAVDVLAFALGHELTHAYNDLQYALEKNTTDQENVFQKNRYRNIITKMKELFATQNEQSVANILYCLSRVERNAYIAQLRQELLSKRKDIVDNKSALVAIKQTESYQWFYFLNQNIGLILKGDFSENSKNEIRLTLNNLMGLHLTNFGQVRKYFNRRWDKWKKAYLTKASKIVYDIFSENNEGYDGIDMSKKYNINNN